jgi:hypothetical protein
VRNWNLTLLSSGRFPNNTEIYWLRSIISEHNAITTMSNYIWTSSVQARDDDAFFAGLMRIRSRLAGRQAIDDAHSNASERHHICTRGEWSKIYFVISSATLSSMEETQVVHLLSLSSTDRRLSVITICKPACPPSIFWTLNQWMNYQGTCLIRTSSYW